jgi:hypothetical protein
VGRVTVQAGDFGVLCAGPSAAAADGPAAALLATPRVLIGGGTVEMQLNMIGAAPTSKNPSATPPYGASK